VSPDRQALPERPGLPVQKDRLDRRGESVQPEAMVAVAPPVFQDQKVIQAPPDFQESADRLVRPGTSDRPVRQAVVYRASQALRGDLGQRVQRVRPGVAVPLDHPDPKALPEAKARLVSLVVKAHLDPKVRLEVKVQPDQPGQQDRRGRRDHQVG
jgi:hypothetical protein